MAKSHHQKFSSIALIGGIILITLSFTIWYYQIGGYLDSIQSEIAGAGIAILFAGIVFKLFKIRLV